MNGVALARHCAAGCVLRPMARGFRNRFPRGGFPAPRRPWGLPVGPDSYARSAEEARTLNEGTCAGFGGLAPLLAGSAAWGKPQHL